MEPSTELANAGGRAALGATFKTDLVSLSVASAQKFKPKHKRDTPNLVLNLGVYLNGITAQYALDRVMVGRVSLSVHSAGRVEVLRSCRSCLRVTRRL
jgi:hypothetical protein